MVLVLLKKENVPSVKPLKMRNLRSRQVRFERVFQLNGHKTTGL